MNTSEKSNISKDDLNASGSLDTVWEGRRKFLNIIAWVSTAAVMTLSGCSERNNDTLVDYAEYVDGLNGPSSSYAELVGEQQASLENLEPKSAESTNDFIIQFLANLIDYYPNQSEPPYVVPEGLFQDVHSVPANTKNYAPVFWVIEEIPGAKYRLWYFENTSHMSANWAVYAWDQFIRGEQNPLSGESFD